MQQARILLSEDEPLLRQIYSDTLSEANFLVDQASDGEEALNKLKSNEYDIALVDIIMPKIDGIQVVKKFKEQSQNHNSVKKIVFLSNLDNEEQKKEALTLADDYIIKSNINPGQLVEIVKHYLDSMAHQ